MAFSGKLSASSTPTDNTVRFLHSIFFLVTLSLLLSACSSFNCTPLESFLGGDVNLINLGEKIAEDLVDDAMPPLIAMHPELPILVSTFVTTDDLNKTSRFGRLLQTHVGTALVQERYSVKEINLRDTMDIQPQEGEKMLSRDLDKISKEQPAQAILVGTYSLNNRILYITAKLVDPQSRTIMSAQSYRLCMDDNLLAMFGLKRRMHDPNELIQPPSESFIDKIFF